MREAFALQNNLSFFSNKKYWHISDIEVWNFNVSLTNDIDSFEQLGPGLHYLPRILNSSRNWKSLLRNDWGMVSNVQIIDSAKGMKHW